MLDPRLPQPARGRPCGADGVCAVQRSCQEEMIGQNVNQSWKTSNNSRHINLYVGSQTGCPRVVQGGAARGRPGLFSGPSRQTVRHSVPQASATPSFKGPERSRPAMPRIIKAAITRITRLVAVAGGLAVEADTIPPHGGSGR